MRLTGSRAYTRPILVPKMPSGLVEVMEGLTKDVLKNNPANVYEFCANHMQKLLEIRDGKSTKISLSLEEKICKAQEKVRQRAEQRWQNYVKLTQSEATNENILPPNKDISTENLTTSIVQPVLQNTLKDPVYHDKELAADSEVEISYELVDKIETAVNNTPSGKDVEKLFDTDVEVTDVTFKKDGENTAATSKILITETNDSLLSGDKIRDMDNETEGKELGSAIEKDNRNDSLKAELENENSMNETHSAKQNIETNCELYIDDQNDKPLNALRTDDDVIEMQNKNQNKKEINVELENENQNQETNTALENDRQKSDVDEILHDETFGKDSSIFREIQEKVITLNNSVNAALNIAYIKTSLGEGLEEKKSKDVEASEQSLVPKNNQTNEDSSEITVIESKVEIRNYSAENKEDYNDVAVQQNDVSGVENNITKPESDNKIVPVQNHEEISALLLNKEISYEFTGKSPKPTDDTNVDDNKEQSDIILKHQQSDISPSSIINENYQNDRTGYNNTKEKSLVESKVAQDNEMSDLDKGNKLESYDYKANDTLKEKEYSKGYENVKETTPDRDITLIKSSVSVEGDGVKDNLIGLQSHDATQDEVNDHGNMNLETAAITIQKVFRNFLFKSRAESTFDDTANDDGNVSDEDSDNKVESEFSLTSSSLNKERRGLGITRMDTMLQTVNEEKSLSLSTDDSSTLSSAATIIQSHVRGFLVRNKLNSCRTISSNSLVNSNPSLEADTDQLKNKTILNIHIVPEGSNLSRDESIITSMDLSLDGSPPSSINLHPLGYDKSERRKQLKREDAIQSISPPSNNSGKLSEDSVKDVIINEISIQNIDVANSLTEVDFRADTNLESRESTSESTTILGVINAQIQTDESSSSPNYDSVIDIQPLTKMSSDEMDVVTPFVPIEYKSSSVDIENTPKLVHSGECHDMVLPTKVSRSETSVVREFKNVLVYILLWNH